VIKTEMFTFQTQKYGPQAMHEAKRCFYMMRQDKHTSVQQYYESFINTVEVIEHCGGDIGTDRSLVTKILGGRDRAIASEAMIVDAEHQAKNKYLACTFILGADKTRYGRMMEDLENSFTQGVDKFPKNMTDAYNLLVNWKQNPQNYMGVVDNTYDGVMFVTNGTKASDTAGFAGKCWICKEVGHRKNECPMRAEKFGEHPTGETKGTQLLMEAISMDQDDANDYEFMFHMTGNGVTGFLFQQSCVEKLDKWILLDNQSTVNVFCNPDLVRNIRNATTSLQLRCNAGTVHVNQVADLPGYPEPVWYHKDGIANILSLARVSKFFPVTFNNKEGFVIHKPEGRKHVFKESDRGLFYLDTTNTKKNNMMQEDAAVMVMTVDKQKAKYSARDIQRAELARKLQHLLGHPSTKHFKQIVAGNQLKNCPIGIDDIVVAEDIFGQSIGALNGKTVHKKLDVVRGMTTPLPMEIIEKYRNVTLAFDLMYVNKIAFLLTLSRDIRFGTAVRVQSRKVEDIKR
jgi:hypothetical protein